MKAIQKFTGRELRAAAALLTQAAEDRLELAMRTARAIAYTLYTDPSSRMHGGDYGA